MDECIHLLGEATVILTLDACSKNWNIEINDADKDKTASSSHHVLYCFVRMPIGLRNALHTLQHTMDVILYSIKWQLAFDYLNDIVVFSGTPK